MIKPRITKIPKPLMQKIEAKKDSKEWIMDELGYFLIDPRLEDGVIYAHHYTKDKKYHCSIEGKTAEEIYYTILREELVGSLMHAAYLGSELQKAELYLRYMNGNYIQDEPLYLNTDGEEEEE